MEPSRNNNTLTPQVLFDTSFYTTPLNNTNKLVLRRENGKTLLTITSPPATGLKELISPISQLAQEILCYPLQHLFSSRAKKFIFDCEILPNPFTFFNNVRWLTLPKQMSPSTLSLPTNIKLIF